MREKESAVERMLGAPFGPLVVNRSGEPTPARAARRWCRSAGEDQGPLPPVDDETDEDVRVPPANPAPARPVSRAPRQSRVPRQRGRATRRVRRRESQRRWRRPHLSCSAGLPVRRGAVRPAWALDERGEKALTNGGRHAPPGVVLSAQRPYRTIAFQRRNRRPERENAARRARTLRRFACGAGSPPRTGADRAGQLHKFQFP